MKYEFASPEWFAALHAVIVKTAVEEAKSRPALWMSICEIFHDVPAHLSPTGTLAWSCVVDGDKVDFRTNERDDVEIKVVADYQSTTALSRYIVGADSARKVEFADMVADRIKKGLFSLQRGERRRDENMMSPIHDMIARVTA